MAYVECAAKFGTKVEVSVSCFVMLAWLHRPFASSVGRGRVLCSQSSSPVLFVPLPQQNQMREFQTVEK